MKTVLHKAESRGYADHGWLKAYHSFSFANYYNPDNIHFGALRVLNDDTIDAGKGFDTHPHENMEIITIPLSGEIEHKDSMGNSGVISAGEIQVMSAGTGIQHSEFNENQDKHLKVLQIWVFPNKKNVDPRYDQISLKDIEKENELFQILSPNKNDQGVWIHQNTWFYMGNLKQGWEGSFKLNEKNNGVYIFIIEGKISIENQELHKRDGIGITETSDFTIIALSDSRILIMEVPMINL
ncbi:MAG: pirin family protein [Bacteroidales bacterium]|jgi:redox-sensitive bicupin YhaK (pirin superfamily)|nr:pirin family protein [Bacteroidales bacterium]